MTKLTMTWQKKKKRTITQNKVHDKHEQHEPHNKPRLISCPLEVLAVP